MTPMTLWQGYNPTTEPLDVVVNGVKNNEKYVSKEVSFTAETVADGKIRAYANIVVQKNKVAPTFLYLPSGESSIKRTAFFDLIVDAGFNIIAVDFAGRSPKKKVFTEYPESLSYCNFSENKELAYSPCQADMSPWFVWMKVVRRAITLAFEESNVDKNNFFLIGNLEGGQLAWKVAGIDGRVSCVIPVGADGFTEFFNKPKYDSNPTTQFSDEWECYLAGMSTQAYARMLTCPVYCVLGTNSSYADIDRLSDLFNLIPHNKKFSSFSVGTNVSISLQNFTGAVEFVKSVVEGTEETLPRPGIKTYVSDGRLYASVTDIGDMAKTEVYYSTDEITPAFRRWEQCEKPVLLNNEEVLCELHPAEENKILFVFANVTLKNGIVLSTQELMMDLTKVSLNDYDEDAKTTERILYNNEMTTVPFSVENFSPVVDNDVLKIKTGPLGLKGFTTTEGRLCTYDVKPPETSSIRNEDYILQLEAYSEEKRNVRIVMYTAENTVTKYTSVLHLEKSKKWQRFNLEISDFKTADRKTLKDWRLVKIMKIKDAENVLFNNILWI